MEFKFSDETMKMFDRLAKNLTDTLSERVVKEQNELLEAFRGTAVNGKILYDECLKQGFDKEEAIKFTIGFLVGISK